MPEVALLLWDVGGVLLSNAWDEPARHAAVDRFGLDGAEFERRHHLAADAFETGHLDLDGYVARTVFYEPRRFAPEEFQKFMFDWSRPHPGAIETARAFRAGGRYVLATLNNESRELNDYRLRTFGLAEIFHAFFSSCYTGCRKPDPAAFRAALQFLQREPEETLFLDDRPENVAAAARLGFRTLRVRDPDRVREELAQAGVAPG